MSLRTEIMPPAGKIAWVVILVACTVLEVFAIHRADKETKGARDAQNLVFQRIADGLKNSMADAAEPASPAATSRSRRSSLRQPRRNSCSKSPAPNGEKEVVTMVNPNEGKFEMISPELAAAFAGPAEALTPAERVQREWTRFEQGEKLTIKGTQFEVHEIGETRMVLKLVPKV